MHSTNQPAHQKTHTHTHAPPVLLIHIQSTYHTQGYIALELQLGEVERCRKLYAKYLEAMPYNCQVGRQTTTIHDSFMGYICMYICRWVSIHPPVHPYMTHQPKPKPNPINSLPFSIP